MEVPNAEPSGNKIPPDICRMSCSVLLLGILWRTDQWSKGEGGGEVSIEWHGKLVIIDLQLQ